MIDKSFLELLLATDSVSGNEQSSLNVVAKHLEGVAKLRTDIIGNLYATINEGSQPKIMLEAHIDEVGFQVSYIDSDGYIYLRALGGIDVMAAIGNKICISNRKGGKTYGVIGKTPVHLLKADERSKVPEMESVWVDTGMSAEQVGEHVSVGDYACIVGKPEYLGKHKLAGKALDNKLGVYAISEAIRRLSSDGFAGASVTSLFSVQEEVGCKGAAVASIGNDFDIIISVDATFAADVPGVSPKIVGDIKLGLGAVLSLHSDVNRLLADEIATSAEGINLQLSANYAASGGTNMRALQLSTQIAQTALICIPLRYMHTPVEVCDLRDVESAVELIVKYMKSKFQ